MFLDGERFIFVYSGVRQGCPRIFLIFSSTVIARQHAMQRDIVLAITSVRTVRVCPLSVYCV